MKSVLLVVALVVCVTLVAAEHPNAHKATPCLKCHMFVEMTTKGKVDAVKACEMVNMCVELLPYQAQITEMRAKDVSVDNVCKKVGLCPLHDLWEEKIKARAPFAGSQKDIRVTPALGREPYGKVRLSKITMETDQRQPISQLDYDQQFKYRWTDRHIQTGLVNVTPGAKNNFDLGDVNVTVRFPAKDTVKMQGLVYADPCYVGKFLWCDFGEKFQIFDRLSTLTDLVIEKDNADWWGVIGDNFYDRDGSLAPPFFMSLSLKTKGTPFITNIGNHDFWALGTPWMEKSVDNYGYGWAQYYAQDTIASHTGNGVPFDYTNDPDHPAHWFKHLSYVPTPDNFFTYSRMGNAVFMTWSSIHSMDDTKPYFEEACQFVQNENPDWVILYGHYNAANFGAQEGMQVPAIHKTIKSIPGCIGHGAIGRILFIEGHEHCNYVAEKNQGIMIGGQGMVGLEHDCKEWGPAHITTTANNVLIYYFKIADLKTGYDQYDLVKDCIEANGVEGCHHLGTLWMNYTLP